MPAEVKQSKSINELHLNHLMHEITGALIANPSLWILQPLLPLPNARGDGSSRRVFGWVQTWDLIVSIRHQQG